MASRARSRTVGAAISILAITGSLVLTGCAEDEDCDSMGTTQQQSIHEIALASATVPDTGNDAATLPDFATLSFTQATNVRADDTQVLADDCGDDGDDEDGDD